jgi:hypothetical protein
MTGNPHSCCASNKITRKCKQESWLPTIVSAVVSSQSHGIASVARLQREEVSRRQQEAWETSSNSTGIYMGCASSSKFSSFLLVANHTARLTNLLEVLHLSKPMANLITCYWQWWRSFWLLPIPPYCKSKSYQSQWHFNASCQCFPILHHHSHNYRCSSCCWLPPFFHWWLPIVLFRLLKEQQRGWKQVNGVEGMFCTMFSTLQLTSEWIT